MHGVTCISAQRACVRQQSWISSIGVDIDQLKLTLSMGHEISILRC